MLRNVTTLKLHYQINLAYGEQRSAYMHLVMKEGRCGHCDGTSGYLREKNDNDD
jgi:hypothetical protein